MVMVACAPTNGLPSGFNYNEKKEMMHLFIRPRNLAQPVSFFPWQFDQKRGPNCKLGALSKPTFFHG
jgi:hypothetical protein